MTVIPGFREQHGMLPAGDYEVSFEELRQSVLVKGGTVATRRKVKGIVRIRNGGQL